MACISGMFFRMYTADVVVVYVCIVCMYVLLWYMYVSRAFYRWLKLHTLNKCVTCNVCGYIRVFSCFWRQFSCCCKQAIIASFVATRSWPRDGSTPWSNNTYEHTIHTIHAIHTIHTMHTIHTIHTMHTMHIIHTYIQYIRYTQYTQYKHQLTIPC